MTVNQRDSWCQPVSRTAGAKMRGAVVLVPVPVAVGRGGE
jgi:hypothetical protein